MNIPMNFKRSFLVLFTGIAFLGSMCQAGGDLPLSMPYIPHDVQYEIYKAIGQDKRLQLSVLLLGATAAVSGYEGLQKIKAWFEKPKEIDEDMSLQGLAIKNVGQRMLDANKKPELIDSENNFFVCDREMPVLTRRGNIFWQLKVLHQSLTGKNMHEDEYRATGIIFEKFKDQLTGLNQHEGVFGKIGKLFGGGRSVAGGNLSCGYQAIKNVVLLLNALHAGNDDEQYSDSIMMLQNINYALDLFGQNPSGMWRRAVEEMRKKELLKWSLECLSYKKFLKNEYDVENFEWDEGINPQRILAIYSTIAGDLNAQKIEEELAKVFSSKGSLTLTRKVEELKNAIKDTEKYFEQYEGELLDINQHIKDEGVIQRYISEENSKLTCNISGSDIFLKETAKHYNGYEQRKRNGLQEIQLDGEDLNDKELQQLIEFERNQGLLKPFADVHFYIVQDDELVEEPDGQVIIEIKERLAQDHCCHVIFLHGDAHWIAFIINKVGEHVEYIIADSLNIPRYGEKYVKSVPFQEYSINDSELVNRIHKIIQSIDSDFILDEDFDENLLDNFQ